MIERNLSDHVGDRRREAEQSIADLGNAYYRRQVEGQRALERWEAAKASKSLWKRLRRVETPEEAAAWDRTRDALTNLDAAEAELDQAKIGRERLAAGDRGERVIPDHLRDRSNQWIVFNGYRNRRGEIDHLILGPLGLWAVEVKNQRVLLDVSGQNWMAHKLDTSGKVVGEQPATDRDGTGRNWGRQVAEPAEVLADNLTAAGHPIPIQTAVILVKPGAVVARCTDPGVDLVTADLSDLDRAMKMLAHRLDEGDIAVIAERIEAGHRPSGAPVRDPI